MPPCRRLLTIGLMLVVTQVSGTGTDVPSTASHISPEDAQKIDALFARWSKPGTPGCALDVLKDGATLYEHSYGLADVEHSVPITSSTVFDVASDSKQITAFAIYLLAKDGRLSLDDDIRKYTPELHDFGKTITIRHLLHHTSGLRDQFVLLMMGSWRLDDVVTQQDVLNLIWRQRDLNFVPGDQFLYSNTEYTLLGPIVERVSGMSLRQFTDERIFEPLGMNLTHFHEHYGDLVSNRAYSYLRSEDGGYEYVADSYSTVGPSSLFTTVGDLARWDENFYTGSVGGKELLAQMQEKGRLNSGKVIDYASGLEIGQYRGLDTVEHSGAVAGFRSEILRFPQLHFSVIALCNAGDADPSELAQRISDILLGSALRPPPVVALTFHLDHYARRRIDPPHPTPKQLTAYTGTFYSEELDTLYTVSVRDSRLYVRTPLVQLEMSPVNANVFSVAYTTGVIRYQCSSGGRCDGFLVSDNRVRNLRFRRVNLSSPVPAP